MSDERTLLSGTAVNIAGLVAGVAAAFGVQILMGRHLGRSGLGLVTVAVQVAFVAAAGSRFGMDLSAVRDVAIGRGSNRSATLRSLVDRCTLLAVGVSVAASVVIAACALWAGNSQVAVAAGSIPFAAATAVYLGATRGLKAMTPTLWVFWIGQPLAWIVLAVLALRGRRWHRRRLLVLRRLLGAGHGRRLVVLAPGKRRLRGRARDPRGVPRRRPLRAPPRPVRAARPDAVLG
jgi:O-antigen/teichoic acid export membrane protein